MRATRRIRQQRRLLVATVVAAMSMTGTALASPGSHVDGDGGATGSQVADGPATAGLAWTTPLGVRLENEPNGSFLASNGLAVLQGRNAETNRGVVYAIDPADGTLGWSSPALDVDHACPGVAGSDDRIFVQDDASSSTNPSPDAQLVALDATTGKRLPGQVYNGEDAGDGRLGACDANQRLVLTEDESLVLVASGTGGRMIRAIDVDSSSPTAFTEVWRTQLVDKDGSTFPPTASPVMLTGDGEGFYIVYRWDSSAPVAEQVWRLERFDLADGTSDGFVDLPGSTYVASTGTTAMALEDGIVLQTGHCPGRPADAGSDHCVIRYRDVNGTFTQAWRTYASEDTGQNFFRSLARMGPDIVGGFADVGPNSGLAGLDLDTGRIAWTTETPFSNNGFQFVTDPDGNGYFGGFGEYHLRSVAPDGQIRWGIEHCHLVDGIEPAVVGPIGYDGTLVTMARDPGDDSKEVVRGFRSGSTLPKGECPEESERLSGVNRVETAVEISNVSFPGDDSGDVVVLATSTNYPDALAGGPLARRLDAPLLLTAPDALSAPTRVEIERLGARTAVLLGGTVALSQAVEAELVSMGLAIDRVAGADRFETAGLIAERVPSTSVYVTEGVNADPRRGWPDAVAVSGLASFQQRPILLVAQDAAPSATLAAMDDLDVTEAVVVGGEVAVSDEVVRRLESTGAAVTREAGDSRFGTSVEVAQRSVAAGASTSELWFATGLAFPDALAAGPAVAKAGGVLVLVHGTDPAGGREVYDWLGGLDDEQLLNATFVGGPVAISDAVADALLSTMGFQP